MTGTSPPAPAGPTPSWLLIGCGDDRGTIQTLAWNDGRPVPVTTVHTGSSTSYFAAHPGGRLAYVTNNRTDEITTLTVNAGAGGLSVVGRTPVQGAPGSERANPTFLSVAPDGRALWVANYRGNNVQAFALAPDGAVGSLWTAQASGERAHAVVLSPDGRHVYATYLGSDLLAQAAWRPDADPPLQPLDPPALRLAPGTGPRHLQFEPTGRVLHVVGETGGTLTTCRRDPDSGALTVESSVRCVRDDGRRWSADLQLHPTRPWLYVTNRAEDTLARFELGAGPPALRGFVDLGGRTPRGSALTADGRWLSVALQDEQAVALFALGDDGVPRATAVLPVGMPVYFVAYL